ncbi:MAG: hypothetical protein H7249_01885 [Chitinophagaceae bacterium]|nr:hypothetical protein [Oligoflexus sp.]
MKDKTKTNVDSGPSVKSSLSELESLGSTSSITIPKPSKFKKIGLISGLLLVLGSGGYYASTTDMGKGLLSGSGETSEDIAKDAPDGALDVAKKPEIAPSSDVQSPTPPAMKEAAVPPPGPAPASIPPPAVENEKVVAPVVKAAPAAEKKVVQKPKAGGSKKAISSKKANKAKAIAKLKKSKRAKALADAKKKEKARKSGASVAPAPALSVLSTSGTSASPSAAPASGNPQH